MDFSFTAEQETFRQEVRKFLAANLTPDLRRETDRDETSMGPLGKAFVKRLGERGWLGLGWPKEYGGQGLSAIDQWIFLEEMAYANLPTGGLTLSSVGPTLTRIGSADQKQRYIPGILRGEIEFAVGYTEPNAGTDLASLQTRAVRDGDVYVVNGQKIYTTAAHHATHIWLLARTDPRAPPSKRIAKSPHYERVPGSISHFAGRREENSSEKHEAQARSVPRAERRENATSLSHSAPPFTGASCQDSTGTANTSARNWGDRLYPLAATARKRQRKGDTRPHMVRLDLPIVCPSCRTPNPADVPSCRTCAHPLTAFVAPASPPPEQGAASPGAPLLARLAEGTFVGRERETALLRAGLDDACSGRGRVLLVMGEPGIGKTRIVNELAVHARQRRVQVLPGRCYEGEGAPPFWPWMQIVRAYMADCDLATLRTEMGPGAADIALVFPEVRERLADLPTPAGLDSEQARFRSFDSFTTFLKRAAQRQPLMLILDDLHWADTPSLLLLQFVVREVGSSRLLIVGTYRDLAFGRAHPLARALGGIVREPCSQSVTLRGLSEHDVARFIESTTDQPPSAALVASVHKITDGNPFFLTEVVRLLCDAGNQSLVPGSRSGIVIPQGVRAAIGQRLLGLSVECQQALTLAAVIGREFDVEVLKGVGASLSPAPTGDWFLELLEEAVAARIVSEVPPIVGRYSFSHALIREALYEELSPARRVRLHQQIAEALERLYAVKLEAHPSTGSEQVLAGLAYHFLQAARGGGDADKAIAYAARAGEQAMAALAYEEAVLHYQCALQALEFKEANETLRCELLLTLGAAQRKTGDIAAARDTFQQAAVLARQFRAQKGDPQAASFLARAALGFGGDAWVEYGTVDEPLVALLEEALEALDLGDSVLRARVLGRLAVALFYFADGRERRTMLSQQAVEMARRVGDTATLAYALHGRHWALWGEANVEERLAVATEIVRLAEQTRARELALIGHAWRIADRLELGEIEAVDEDIAVFARLAVALRQPLYLWWTLVLQAMRALLEGRFAEVEQLAQQAVAMGQQVHPQASARIFWIQFVNLRRQQGRLAELEAAMTQLLAQQLPSVAGQRIGLALLYSDLGREAEARREFTALAAHGFADLPRDQTWLISLALLAQICAFLADTRHAATLYEFLRPHAGRTTVAGNVAPVVCLGAASRILGSLAATLSHWEQAERHFTDALAMNARLGARPYVAHTQHEYARMLLARNHLGDREKALELLDMALATAQELGMKGLEEKIQGLGARGWALGEEERTDRSVETPDSELQTPNFQSPTPTIQHLTPSPQHPAANVFRREGAYWTLIYQGTICRLKDAKGLHYIAILLRHSGQEFHVVDLAALTAPRPTTSVATRVEKPSSDSLTSQTLSIATGRGDAGSMLDAQARTAYRRRLEDLRDELEEAERFHDSGRAAKAQAEIDFITRELAAAYGLRGRSRKSGSDSEKVRQAVGYCIRSSLNKIRTTHPALWRHLFAALKTGTFCSYNPEHPTSWEL